MNIKYGRSKKSVKASKSIRKSIHASRDYATLRGMDFSKARDILIKDGFHEHEYGDKDDNNGYAVYRKGDKEVELQYRWNAGKRKNEYHAGKVTNVYVDDDINGACGKKSIKSNKRRGIKASRSNAPRRRMRVMAGSGAGYTIEWELERIRRVNSFDVTDVSKPDKWGTVTVTADCDVDIDVTIKSAWSYMYGFNHPIEGVSAKIHRVVFDYNISDNYGDLLNFEDYEDLTDDAEYIDEVYNMVYQINEMDAVDILEDDAWEAIKGDEFSYGGGYSHSTWDGTLLEIDDYNFADIQVTDQMVIEYVDAAVTNENLMVEYKIDDYNFRDDYFESEEEAREAAISAIQSGEVDYDLTIIKTEWHGVLLNTEGEVDYDDYYDEDVATIYYDDYAPEE